MVTSRSSFLKLQQLSTLCQFCWLSGCQGRSCWQSWLTSALTHGQTLMLMWQLPLNTHEFEQLVRWASADRPSLYSCATATYCRACFSAKAVGQAADLQASLLSHRNGAVQARVLQLVLSSVAQSAERHWQGEAGQAEALLFDLATVRVALGAMGPAGHLQVWQTLVPLILPEGGPYISTTWSHASQTAKCMARRALWWPQRPTWKGQAMRWLCAPWQCLHLMCFSARLPVWICA